MTDIKELTITNETGRVDKVLAENFAEYSRSQIQQWLREGLVLANDQPIKANYRVNQGDLLQLQVPEPKQLALQPENIPLTIVYEDQDVVVVNKPQGMVVHPSAGHTTGTLVHALLYQIDSLSSINDVVRPGIVHRIDKDTSGLLMVAKNDAAHESLTKQLQEKTILRRYIALVHGIIPHDKGTIEAPIGRSFSDRKQQAVREDGKPAITHFRVLERYTAGYTLVTCQLETGRTHQIRVHMQYIGYPLAGDPVYGPRKTLPGNGQFLHAAVLGFHQPSSGEWLEFEAPLPELFEKTLAELAKKN